MRRFILIAPLVLTAVACNNGSSSSSTTTAPTPTTVTEILTGTVQPPVNGVFQSSANNFTVGQGGGTVTVTLTSAVQTLPGGVLKTDVLVGLAVGTASGTTCTPLAGATLTAIQASSAAYTLTVAAGSYCVLISDVSGQGPIAYAVAVNHP
jgi:hypothetical protein